MLGEFDPSSLMERYLVFLGILIFSGIPTSIMSILSANSPFPSNNNLTQSKRFLLFFSIVILLSTSSAAIKRSRAFNNNHTKQILQHSHWVIAKSKRRKRNFCYTIAAACTPWLSLPRAWYDTDEVLFFLVVSDMGQNNYRLGMWDRISDYYSVGRRSPGVITIFCCCRINCSVIFIVAVWDTDVDFLLKIYRADASVEI